MNKQGQIELIAFILIAFGVLWGALMVFNQIYSNPELQLDTVGLENIATNTSEITTSATENLNVGTIMFYGIILIGIFLVIRFIVNKI